MCNEYVIALIVRAHGDMNFLSFIVYLEKIKYRELRGKILNFFWFAWIIAFFSTLGNFRN